VRRHSPVVEADRPLEIDLRALLAGFRAGDSGISEPRGRETGESGDALPLHPREDA
jgi:hypothetical protein